tara:strand:- start:131 stop:913 length:783 start_codon:yes stop_codon:yes gene_type:complete
MIKTFERFNLLPFSPSRINNWIEDKSNFVLHYIYKYDFAPSCAMIRGNAIEYGISLFFKNRYKKLDTLIKKMYQNYDDNAYFSLESEEEKKKQRDMIEPMSILLFDKITKTNSTYLSFQMKVETNILEIPFRGFTDFTFENDEEITVIDLKTSSQFRIRDSHIKQQVIYKKALQEKFFNKKVDVKLLYCTPKKCDFIEFDSNDPIHLKTIELNLRSCADTLDKCKSNNDVSSILIPDLSDWRWNYASEDKLKAREEIWGI